MILTAAGRQRWALPPGVMGAVSCCARQGTSSSGRRGRTQRRTPCRVLARDGDLPVSMPVQAVRLLKRPQTLAVLDPRDVQIAYEHGTLMYVSSGELVGRAGHLPGRVIVVKDGEIEITTRTAAGRRVVLALAQAGHPIGDIPFLLNQPMMFDALARTRSTLVALDREHWLQMLASSPGLAYRWMQSVARRLDAD